MTKKIENFDEKINNLTLLIESGLKDFNEKFERVNEKFDGVYRKFEGIDKKLESIDKKIDDKVDGLAIITKNGFGCVDRRFDKVESRLDKIEFKTNSEHSRRLEILEDGMREVRAKLKII